MVIKKKMTRTKIWTMMATTLSRRIPPLRKGTRIAFSRTGEEGAVLNRWLKAILMKGPVPPEADREEAVLRTSNTLVIQTEMTVRTTATRIAQISISEDIIRSTNSTQAATITTSTATPTRAWPRSTTSGQLPIPPKAAATPKPPPNG
jgi:hypothetical protein